MSSILQTLQTNHMIWHANHLALNPDTAIPSGYNPLDSKLDGGWPDKGIVEMQVDTIGIGEVRLLLPALYHLGQKKGLQEGQQTLLYVWIAPPGRLNAQMLTTAGLPLANTLVATGISAKEAFWLSEQCLRSGCCISVVLWCNSLEPNQAKRLQLAAKEGNCLGFVIRPPTEVEQSLPVSIRIAAGPHAQGLEVNISKRLGGYPVMPFALDMSQRWPELTQPAPVTSLTQQRSLRNSNGNNNSGGKTP
jgi:cell division inhibitor SulA